jgi:hypothetical protein
MAVTIIDTLRAKNAGTFPLVEDVDQLGGWRVVADLTARDAIPSSKRKVGMWVAVISDGKVYELVGGIGNPNWVEKTFGGGGGGVTTYATEAALLSAAPANGTLGYATDSKHFWERAGGQWQPFDGRGLTTYPSEGDLLADTPEPGAQSYDYEADLLSDMPPVGTIGFALDTLAFWIRGSSSWAVMTTGISYTTETDLLSATPPGGTVGFPLDTQIFRYRRRAAWFFFRADSRWGLAENPVGASAIYYSTGTLWNNLYGRTVLGANADDPYGGVAIGFFAIGSGGVVIGNSASGQGVVIGNSAASSGGVAIGPSAASGIDQSSVAIGSAAAASAAYSNAVGANAVASAQYATVLGYGASGTAIRATVLGANALSTFGDSLVAGYGAAVRVLGGIAIGYNAEVRANCAGSIALGYNSYVSGVATSAIAIGTSAHTNGSTSVACGVSANVFGDGGVGVGGSVECETTGVSIGTFSQAQGIGAVALGYSASSWANYAVAIGRGTTVALSAILQSTASVGIGYGVSVGVRSPYAVVIGAGAYTSYGLDGGSTDCTEAIVIGHNATAQHMRAGAIGNAAASTANDRITIGKVGGSATELKALQVSGGFGMGGVAPTAQRAHVADPSGGGFVDAEARSAINSIFSSLEALGLHATS